ncbi:MAG: deiodinase family protein [Fuerstiella sp.]
MNFGTHTAGSGICRLAFLGCLFCCADVITAQGTATDDTLIGTPPSGSSSGTTDRAEANDALPDSHPPDPLTPAAEQAARELTEQLPAGSEARAMLDRILEGSRLGPGEGWFAMAKSQTLYGWSHVVQTCDENGDEVITAEEFGGSTADFSRLDRNSDEVLTDADFEWSEHSLAMTPGVMLFFQADRDANGKVTQQEFVDLFHSLGAADQGFLALDDVRERFQPPDDQTSEKLRAQRKDAPSRSTLILGLQRQEIGSLQSGPSVGTTAPDFALRNLQGDTVRLSQQIGEKPVVLIFGNFTCGPFRSQAGNIEKLFERYRDRATFFLIYVREAHPADGWWMNSNKRAGIDVSQPTSDSARKQVAQLCQSHLGLEIPFLVDSVNDEVGAAYSGMPNRLYLIDRTGRIVFKNGRGPFGFHPRELEQALVLLLNSPDSKTVR